MDEATQAAFDALAARVTALEAAGNVEPLDKVEKDTVHMACKSGDFATAIRTAARVPASYDPFAPVE